MEAGILALVFEERAMPRATRSDSAAAAAGKEGPLCTDEAEADGEGQGGPEHVVSFEALMTWPDVQVCRCCCCLHGVCMVLCFGED